MIKIARGLAVLAAMLIASAAHALPVPGKATLESAAQLRPGQYMWDETDTSTGPVAIMVSIDRQHLFVYRDDRLIGVTTISSGKPGKDTPLGKFRILQKNIWHRSNLYSNAPMPYMQRLTWTGIAIHGGHLPGVPASHGCIRVPVGFAKKLFAVTDMGGIVSVSDGQTGPFLRIEVDVAALSDGQPVWNSAPSMTRMAAAVAVQQPMPVQQRTKPVQLAALAPMPVPQSPRLSVDPNALLRADVTSATPTASQAPPRDPGQPHWVVPYYQGRRP